MKNIILLILLMGTFFPAYSQWTEYLDETGQTIDVDSFAARAKNGGYEFIPTVENGQIKSLQLRKSVKGITLGAFVPDFSLRDINGKKYSLKDLRGRVIVLNFWFTQCVGCIAEMPELNNLLKKFCEDPGVIFLGVTYDTVDKVQHFLARKEFNFNIVCDGAAMIKTYGINVYPTTMVIDQHGKLTFISTGMDTEGIKQLGERIRVMPRYFPLD